MKFNKPSCQILKIYSYSIRIFVNIKEKFVEGLFSFRRKKIHVSNSISRYHVFQKLVKQIDNEEGGLDKFTLAHHNFGIHVDRQTNEIKAKIWAPKAKSLYLRGDFSLFLNKNDSLFISTKSHIFHRSMERKGISVHSRSVRCLAFDNSATS